jgi:cell division protein FtsA
LVQAELQRSGFENLLAAGVVLTGGTSKMEGVMELAEEIFHAPVRIGTPHKVKGLADIVRNPIYSTGVGLLLYGLKQYQERGGIDPKKEPQVHLVDRVKNWFQGNF